MYSELDEIGVPRTIREQVAAILGKASAADSQKDSPEDEIESGHRWLRARGRDVGGNLPSRERAASLPLISNAKFQPQDSSSLKHWPGTGRRSQTERPTPRSHPALFPNYFLILANIAINTALFLHWVAAGNTLHRDIVPFTRKRCKHCGVFTAQHLGLHLTDLDLWVLRLLEDALAGKHCSKPASYCEAEPCRLAARAASVQALAVHRSVEHLRSPQAIDNLRAAQEQRRRATEEQRQQARAQQIETVEKESYWKGGGYFPESGYLLSPDGQRQLVKSGQNAAERLNEKRHAANLSITRRLTTPIQNRGYHHFQERITHQLLKHVPELGDVVYPEHCYSTADANELTVTWSGHKSYTLPDFHLGDGVSLECKGTKQIFYLLEYTLRLPIHLRNHLHFKTFQRVFRHLSTYLIRDLFAQFCKHTVNVDDSVNSPEPRHRYGLSRTSAWLWFKRHAQFDSLEGFGEFLATESQRLLWHFQQLFGQIFPTAAKLYWEMFDRVKEAIRLGVWFDNVQAAQQTFLELWRVTKEDLGYDELDDDYLRRRWCGLHSLKDLGWIPRFQATPVK
jgi:hypothetical protein